ncbi:hypothetical protein KPL76_06315 [Subtercola sp. PAMC28395]|uniref:hypothetical protein n=1 Tax=Subtercola sp. PAMC28395 TaxID=2846775 RepID=UPI001C0AB4DC|nr:hypothetical protein [Subtercola sp. PAMC28395]QWT24967.1 hypothetical protein KPL76_06315 [Subtercola sp. PAMC28395]
MAGLSEHDAHAADVGCVGRRERRGDTGLMNIAETTAPKSDQQNFDDYGGGPKTVTVTEVKNGNAEQPVEVHLAEFPGRPFKPSKSMRRVLLACWGSDSAVYAGRRMTLYGDPEVKFGGQKVGGIRIAALSNIDKPATIALTVTRAKREPFTVQPLDPPKDTSGRDWLAELNTAGDDMAAVFALGQAAKEANASRQVMTVLGGVYKKLEAAALAAQQQVAATVAPAPVEPVSAAPKSAVDDYEAQERAEFDAAVDRGEVNP